MAKVQGLDKLKKKLAALPKETRAELRAALQKSADEIVAMQKRLAPKETGELANSIVATPGGKGPAYSQGAASPTAGDPDLSITITAGNTRVRYAHLVEFGTRPHTIRAKDGGALGPGGIFGTEVEHPGATAQPFFYPGYRALKKRVRGRISRGISKAAKKVAAGT